VCNICFAALACSIVGCAGGNKSQQSNAPEGDKAAPVSAKNDNAKNAALNKWLREVEADIPQTVYRVQPPDAIRVTAPAIKELDKAEAKIRSDGKVTLNLVGEIYVAGLSSSEIADELTKRLAKFYQKDTIYVSVEVTAFESKKYYVFGQVFAPGVKNYTGRDTIVKALADAGLNEDAWPQKVVLVRPHEDQNIRQKVTVDLKAMYQSGKTDQNYLLEEGDLIYVPPSPLAEFKMKFDRLFSPIKPVAEFAIMAATGI
jgi:polysaccharide export outer membrane protein